MTDKKVFRSTKTFGHNLGISAAFRQWRANSHCRFVHGYAAEITFVFETDDLDIRNWCVDFGSMKSLKTWIENTFDHKLLVAEDDPFLDTFKELHAKGIADVVVVSATGCEKFAELIFEVTEIWLKDNGYYPRAKLISVEFKEHGANSAIYTNAN